MNKSKMFELLEKLRAKSEKTKKQISFLAALLTAGIIFVIWLSVVYPDFNQRQTQETLVINNEPTPVSSFSATFSSGVSAIGEQFSKIKNLLSSFSTAPVYYSATSTIKN